MSIPQGQTKEFSVIPKTIIDGVLPTLYVADGFIPGARVSVTQFANGSARVKIETSASTPKNSYSLPLSLTIGQVSNTVPFNFVVN